MMGQRFRYGDYERQRIKKRLTELMGSTNSTTGRKLSRQEIADIMRYEGFKKANGAELDAQWVSNRSMQLLDTKERKVKNSAGPVRDVMSIGKCRDEQAQMDVTGVKDVIGMLVRTEVSDAVLGEIVRKVWK